MSDYEHFRIRNVDDVLIIELVDPKLFDVSIVMAWQEELLRLVDRELPTRAIIDFSRVEHCSTSVINGLLSAKKRISRNGGVLKLCGMIETIRDAYRMLNLDGTVFQIYDTVDDALSAF
jgi:anti-anti-sigma factor